MNTTCLALRMHLLLRGELSGKVEETEKRRVKSDKKRRARRKRGNIGIIAHARATSGLVIRRPIRLFLIEQLSWGEIMSAYRDSKRMGRKKEKERKEKNQEWKAAPRKQNLHLSSNYPD